MDRIAALQRARELIGHAASEVATAEIYRTGRKARPHGIPKRALAARYEQNAAARIAAAVNLLLGV